MSKGKDDIKTTRKWAEDIIEGDLTLDSLTEEEFQKLVYELKVSRAELEQQNEELREAQESLQVSQNEYYELFHFAPIGYVIITGDGIIRKANLSFATLLGANLQQLIGKHLFRYTQKAYQPCLVQWIKMLNKANHQNALEIRLIGSESGEGAFVHLQTGAQPPGREFDEFDEATLIHHISVLDITEKKEAEKAIKESEARFRGIAERSVDIIFSLTADGRFDFISPSVERVTGYSMEELDNTGFPMLIHEQDQEKTWEAFTRALNGEIVEQFQYRIKRKDGETVLLSSNAAPVYKDGNIAGVQGVSRDITEEQAYLEKIEQSEKNFRTIVEGAPYGIFVTDETGRYTEVNETACAQVGLSREELLEKSIPDLLHPEDIELALGVFSSVKTEGYGEAQLRYVTSRGETRQWVVSASKLSDGRILGFTIDITERIEQEALYKRILETTADGFWLVDKNGFVTTVNHATCELLGYTESELIGMHVSHIDEGESEEEAKARMKAIMEAGQVRFETVHRRKDGVLVDVEVSVSSLMIGDMGFVVFVRDITERKKAEEQNRQAYENLTNILTHSPFGVAVIDKSRTIRWVNDYAYELTGEKGKAKLIGEHCSVHFCKETQGVCPILDEGQTLHNYEWVFKRADGGITPILKSVTEILVDGEEMLLETFIDITKQKENQEKLERFTEELEDALARQRALFENSTVGILVVTGERIITEINPLFCEMFGYEPEELIGQSVKILHVSEETYRHFGKTYYERTAEKRNVEVEYQFIKKDGSLFWASISGRALDKNDLSKGVIWALRDITERKEALAQITALSAVVENSDAIIVVKDLDLRVVATNQTFADATGYDSVQALLGKTDAEIFGMREDEEPVKSYMADERAAQTLPKGEAIIREEPVIQPDGTVRTVLTKKYPIYDAENKLIGTGNISLDITDRIEAERALKKSQEQFTLAVEGSQDGLWDWDLTDGSLFLSPRWKEMLGYKDDELTNEFNTFSSLICPADWPKVEEHLNEYLAGETNYYAIEFRMRHKDGHWVDILARGKAIFDEEGKPYRMAGSHTDITERKRAREALKESEARMSSITKSAQDAIVMMDEKGDIAFWNPAAEKIFGYTAKEAIGKNLHGLIAPKRYLKAHKLAFEKFQKTGEGNAVGRTLELQARRKDGHEFDIALSLSAVKLPTGWHSIGIMRDITAKKIAEQELLEANKQLERQTRLANDMAVKAEAASIAKSRFLANMSHEIRTPMNAVVGMADLLLDTDLSTQQAEYASIIMKSADSLLSLINDILDYSKIEANRIEIEHIPFNLRTLIEDIGDVLAIHAHQKELEFICSVPPDIPTKFIGDPSRIRQILLNLANNAIKFTEKGDVTIDVTIAEEDEESALIKFNVIDSGIGIDAQTAKTLFQSFVQADASTTRRYGGTGLGLAISKRLAEMMGGEIGMESTPGQGSLFWFTIHAVKEKALEKAPTPQMQSLLDYRIMAVDDNETNRRVMAAMLEAWGCRYAVVDSGVKALALLADSVRDADPFHLVILDMAMPEMDGEETGRNILENKNSYGKPALVMLTSMVGSEEKERIQALGFNAYLTKPIKQSQLYDALNQIVEAHQYEPAPTQESIEIIEENDAEATAEKRAIVGVNCSELKVLVAEDNRTNQIVALEMLKKLGASVTLADNGKEAIETLKKEKFDIVFMDVQMPVMDGLIATRKIREAEKDSLQTDIPIVAMTANAMHGDKERCLHVGMDDYLAKPIKQKELHTALKKWCNVGV